MATNVKLNVAVAPPGKIEPKPDYRAYKSSLQSVNFIFKDGTKAAFIGGKYLTSKKSEIDELDAEIELNHPHLFHATKEEVIELTTTPMEALRAKFFKEFQAQQASAIDKSNDAGQYTQDKLNPVSTSDVASAASGSTGANPASAGGLKISVPPKV